VQNVPVAGIQFYEKEKTGKNKTKRNKIVDILGSFWIFLRLIIKY